MDSIIWFNLAKSLHIIFMVAWFAGLFYIPRLFIYQAEARELSHYEAAVVISQLKMMARRLWFIITWPAMVITLLAGTTMLILQPVYLVMPWMQVKLGFVFLLVLYHFSLHYIYKKQQNNRYPMTGGQLRFYNELATVLLFAIVFTVVFKGIMSWAYGVGGILLLGVLLSAGILFYRKVRSREK